MHTISEIQKKLADYCAYQDRCHFEVEQKLREYYPLTEEEKGDIISFLITHNFLSEERFSRSFARGKFYLKQWGKIKITTYLKQKQIPEKLIQTGLNEIDEKDYKSTLQKLTLRKWNTLNETNIFTKKRKLISYLSQKGYESFLIYEAIANITDTD